ncbi:MAG: metalloregulator ArsR/SmtB family transcription factor [Deltaproteobacteria bacterium]|nr:metalloregulator ArsR/SmtB family transcription factor [Deltaproteobacteria bacterium]
MSKSSESINIVNELKNFKNTEKHDRSIDELRDIFYALSDKIRLEIIILLIDNEEICACKFQDFFKISQPNLSFHLRILRKSNLVKTQRKGNWIHYSLNGGNHLLNVLIPLIKNDGKL